MDDVFVESNTFEEHLDHLRRIPQFQKGIKLRPSKCRFFRKKVTVLGHMVSSDGYKVNEGDREAVEELRKQRPKTIGEVRRLLGLLGYFRKFVRKFT